MLMNFVNLPRSTPKPAVPSEELVCEICEKAILSGEPRVTYTKPGFTVENPQVATAHANCLEDEESEEW